MSSKTILVVDDEVELVETICFPLEIEGYRVLDRGQVLQSDISGSRSV